jgi:hypothetical protein
LLVRSGINDASFASLDFSVGGGSLESRVDGIVATATLFNGVSSTYLSSLYGVGRMLVFGMFFANAGKRFGYKNFGALAGLFVAIPLDCCRVSVVNISCGV